MTTYPGYTTRPSLHWAFGPQWCSVPGSRPTPSSDAASLATWCHRPRPKPAAWSDLMSCGTRCADREQVGGLLFWHMWQHAAEAYASPEQINICLKWFKNHMLYHSAASSSWLINLKEKKCFRLGYIYLKKKKIDVLTQSWNIAWRSACDATLHRAYFKSPNLSSYVLYPYRGKF